MIAIDWTPEERSWNGEVASRDEVVGSAMPDVLARSTHNCSAAMFSGESSVAVLPSADIGEPPVWLASVWNHWAYQPELRYRKLNACL